MEVRSSPSSGGVGIFATRDYHAGDVILHETAPFIRLAPSSPEQEQTLIQWVQRIMSPTSSSSVAADATTLWDYLAPEESLKIAKEMNGKYRGMIQAVLCYVHYLSQQQQHGDLSSYSITNDDNDQLDQVTKKLLSLYHPHDTTTANPQEQELLQVADQALEFLRKMITKDNDDDDEPFLTLLKTLLDKQPNRLRRIMTIWSCNAFEGGRIYEQASRLNHSCNPNAMFFGSTATTTTTTTTAGSPPPPDDQEDEGQVLKALCDIQEHDEITISYLHVPLLYAETRTRQQQLRWTKHLQCACDRCRATTTTTITSNTTTTTSSSSSSTTLEDDVAGAIPCPTCHVRLAQKQLPEDVQYDDDDDDDDQGGVHYMYPPQFHCAHCKTTTAPSNSIIALAHTISDKVTWYLQELQSKQQRQDTKRRKRMNLQLAAAAARGKNKQDYDDQDKDHEDDDDDEEETDAVLEQHLSLASTMLGARHWTTNLLHLQYLERQLQAMHITQLTQQGQPPEEDQIAECIDALQRIKRFVQDVHLKLHMGHVTCGVTVGVARTLVSLGDVKSQTYAAEWLHDIQTDYVQLFEEETVQKVVTALSVAWQRHGGNEDGGRDKKRQKS